MHLRVGEVRIGIVSVMRIGVAGLLVGHALAGHAGGSSEPLILDTQQGIQDGKGGVLLQTAPLSREPIVEPARPREPAGQAANTSIPIYVAPYVGVPERRTSPPSSQPQPQPQPRQP